MTGIYFRISICVSEKLTESITIFLGLYLQRVCIQFRTSSTIINHNITHYYIRSKYTRPIVVTAIQPMVFVLFLAIIKRMRNMNFA